MPDSTLPTTWSRVVLASITPRVDDGRWPVKRSIGEKLEVVAGVIVDGHEKLGVELIYRHESDSKEHVLRMPHRWNDEYVGAFRIQKLGTYQYRVRAWMDRFGTWQDQFRRRVEGEEEERLLRSELLEGADILEKVASGAPSAIAKQLSAYVQAFRKGRTASALDPHVLELASAHDPREGAIESETYTVQVDPEYARFCAWYEFFPRSAGDDPGKHATLDDAADRLPRIKELGFDVVYLPPVHPIGTTFRKGKDNAPVAKPGEPGSPWAIGSEEGGHTAVHPELGGIEAFDRFVKRATALDIRVAIDIAFQTSPDHPWVKEHPEWFRHRPDGTIRYAENPPKKYQDVYPLDFESSDWQGLWTALKEVFEYWIDHGVRIFRVDNPHTKPFRFWEWCLGELRREHPDLIFLAEAFSRPKIMYTLAKLGFNQSYTYFTWRNSKAELEEYARELFQSEVADFFRPNFWPNTPDILHDYLVHGGRPAHAIRLVLAATMSPAYGLYGPPYEHVDNRQHPEREEYANNEKYEIRSWNWNDPRSLQPLIRRVNRIRRENPALHHPRNIRIHTIDNANMIAYSKQHEDNVILVIVNLDPHNTQSGWVSLPLGDLGLPDNQSYQVHDLLGGERFYWQGSSAFVQLNPHILPAHVLHVPRPDRPGRDSSNLV